MLSTLIPPAVPVGVLREFARSTYGLVGEWSRLEGERDQNFKVTDAEGRSWRRRRRSNILP